MGRTSRCCCPIIVLRACALARTRRMRSDRPFVLLPLLYDSLLVQHAVCIENGDVFSEDVSALHMRDGRAQLFKAC